MNAMLKALFLLWLGSLIMVIGAARPSIILFGIPTSSLWHFELAIGFPCVLVYGLRYFVIPPIPEGTLVTREIGLQKQHASAIAYKGQLSSSFPKTKGDAHSSCFRPAFDFYGFLVGPTGFSLVYLDCVLKYFVQFARIPSYHSPARTSDLRMKKRWLSVEKIATHLGINPDRVC
jgi:hypothetical protein